MRDDDERLIRFLTPRDFLRYAVGRFQAAGLVFGHGATTALDEAAFLILEALHLPIDAFDPFADAKLLMAERRRLLELIEARVETRKPLAYLLRRTYIQGEPFYVDERVIVPRSFIGELLFTGLVGDRGLIAASEAVESVLDLCTDVETGQAEIFDNARIDAADISADALEVAARNLRDHGLTERVTLVESDLFAALKGRRYDLILTNPPYVTSAAVAAFPPEYAAEPSLAHAGGADGLDLVRRIVAEARAHLNPGGALVCEIGQGREAFEAAFPELEVVWLDTAESEGEVFFARAEALPGAARRAKAQTPGQARKR